MAHAFDRELISKVVAHFTKWCAYHHIYKLVRALVNGSSLTEQAKIGRNIALLGLFCPFFWLALLSNANPSTLAFHATHSGIVFLIGVAIMAFNIKKK